MRTRRVKPPPVLDGCRVLAYAFVDRDVQYSGHSHLYVDGNELGPVPRLAICQGLDDEDVLLLHCSARWRSLGAASYATVGEAKARAARIYRGASWVKSGVSKREAATYLKKQWKGCACSFCGRGPDDVRWIVQRNRARICDICVKAFNEAPSR